ncbi:MAG: Trm112 family protein [Pseudomonadota bacterium]|nr:Trm112 family protein [Pseudomonadota bacterium]MEC8710741.1 Trm112 family protein [Pseudomonadota bacterium]
MNSPSGEEPTSLDARVLELLVCPLTKTTLHYDRDAQELVSEQAGLAFPVRGGIPVLLVEEARRL